MKRFHVIPLAVPLATVAAVALLAPLASTAPRAQAGQLGTTRPANCVAHTSLNGGVDVPGDYRCAGLAIAFHTTGASHSPFPIWAGQWLFTDQDGQYRVGYCTFNRGNHPTTAVRSQLVTQTLPNDVGGSRSAYLAWKYGDTHDNLTAAALWAVFHYYAQDAAGTNRATNGYAPLVPRLDGVGADSGRADLQALALGLHDEANRFAGTWALTISLAAVDTAGADGGAEGIATVTLRSGTTPVPGRTVTVLVSGSDLPLAATTGADGTAAVTVPLPSGTVTVAATTDSPGPALVFRGVPAAPDADGAQTLLTGGDPAPLQAVATLDVPPPTTTTVPPTTLPTTTLPTTTLPPTTLPPTTTVSLTTTVLPTTVPTTTVPATTVAPTEPPTTVPEVAESTTTTSVGTTTPVADTFPPPTTAPSYPPPLPRTGGSGDGGVAYLATAFLVGGVGLLGTLRRRRTVA